MFSVVSGRTSALATALREFRDGELSLSVCSLPFPGKVAPAQATPAAARIECASKGTPFDVVLSGCPEADGYIAREVVGVNTPIPTLGSDPRDSIRALESLRGFRMAPQEADAWLCILGETPKEDGATC
jgi:hypothetical protein